MPQLTQIKTTKKGRLALFLDGEFEFSLDEATFAAANLHQGDELEDWQLEELRRKGDSRRALDKAMDYLSLRDHASGDLYQKLCRKFDAETAAWALARVGELGLLDDAGVARRRAAELYRKHKSRREILQDLRAKGIDRDTAVDAVEALYASLAAAPQSADAAGQSSAETGEPGAAQPQEPQPPELSSARALLRRHYARKLALGKRDQVAAALARRGYPHSIIKAALELETPEPPPDESPDYGC